MAERYATAVEIQALIDNSVAESKELDFKLALPGSSSGDKKEFLADVTSLSNTAGGHLIYGIREEGGVAKEVCGIQALDDKAINRLESMIRDGVAPRIAVKQAIVAVSGKQVLVVAIPRSWSRPHMVTFEGSGKFHARGASGKFSMDVSQLRAAFSEAEVGGKRIRDFRLDRLAKIASEQTPCPLDPGPRTVLHLVPLSEDPAYPRFDLGGLGNSGDINPIHGGRDGSRINFDGLYSFSSNGAANGGYCQVFRSGAIEAVDADMFARGDRKQIPIFPVEEEIIRALSRYLRVQSAIGAECPIAVMLSLIGVRGYEMALPLSYLSTGSTSIDRDDLLIPEILIEEWDIDVASVMKPLFDSVWQAAGWEGSLSYDEAGVRKVRL